MCKPSQHDIFHPCLRAVENVINIVTKEVANYSRTKRIDSSKKEQNKTNKTKKTLTKQLAKFGKMVKKNRYFHQLTELVDCPQSFRENSPGIRLLRLIRHRTHIF